MTASHLQVKFDLGQLQRGLCPIPECQNGRVLNSSKGKWEDCLCKPQREWARCLRTDEMVRSPSLQTVSPLHKFYRKNLLVRSRGGTIFSDITWEKLLAHIKSILKVEFHTYYTKRSKGEIYPYPHWKLLPVGELLRLSLSDSEDDREALSEIKSHDPWLILELGETDVRNNWLPELVCQLERQRTHMGKGTWFFTKRSDAWFQERYGSEVVTLLSSLPEAKLHENLVSA